MGRPPSLIMIALVLFAVSVAVVLAAGPRMSDVADRLASATRLGGALMGFVFLAMATNLPEMALTPAAIVSDRAELAVGALLGSAASNLFFIGVADIVVRRRATLAGAPPRMTLREAALLIIVVAATVVGAATGTAFAWIGFGTPLVLAAYIGGLLATRRSESRGESEDRPAPDHGTAALWRRFALLALLLAAAGVGLEHGTSAISEAIGLGPASAGALVAGLATPLPELVTAVSAARRGAAALALGDLLGSSALNFTLLAYADLFYTAGSIFTLIGAVGFVLIGVVLVLVALITLASTRRRSRTTSSVTREGYAIVAVYLVGAAAILAVA